MRSHAGLLASLWPTACALALAVPATCSAAPAPKKIAAGPGIDAPAIIEGATVYQALASRNHHTFYSVRSRARTGAIRTLYSDDVTPAGNLDLTTLTGHAFQVSTTDLAVVTTTTQQTGTDESGEALVAFGPRDDALSVAVAHCASNDGEAAPPPFQLDGSRVAVVGDAACAGNLIRIISRSGPPVTISPPAGVVVDAIDLNGDYVAYAYTLMGARNVVVADSHSGVTRYAVTQPSTGLTLSIDGTLTVSKAASGAACSDGSLTYYIPGAPVAHPVAAAHPCAGATVANGAATYFSGGGSLRRAQLIGGPESTLVPSGIDTAHSALSAAADRAVFTAPDCQGRALYEVPVLTSSAALPSPPACPVRLKSSTLRVRGRDAVARVRCQKGCDGEFELSLTRRLGSQTVAVEFFGQAPGRHYHNVRLRLDAGTARRAGRRSIKAYLFQFVQSRGHTSAHRRRVSLTR